MTRSNPIPRTAGRRPAKALGLRGRLTAVMLLAIAPLLGGILGIGYLAGDRLEANAAQDLADEAGQCARAAGRWEATVLRALRHVQDMPAARAAAVEPIPARAALANLGDLYERSLRLHLTGVDGRVIARSDGAQLQSYADRDWFRRALAGADPVRQTIAVSRTFGTPTVTFAGPVRDDAGRTVAVAAASMQLRTLAATVQCDRIGRTGYAFLVDEAGHLLAHPDPEKLTTLILLADYPPVSRWRRAATAASGGAFRFADPDGTRWLSHAVPVGNGWVAIAVRQEAEVAGLARATVLGAGGVAGAGVLAAAGLTFLAVGRWVRPVRALTAAAERLSLGQWGSTVPTSAVPAEQADELGVLAGAFNRMSSELADAHDRLCRRAEDAEQRYRDIVTHAPIGIYQTSADGRYLKANARLARIYGYETPERLVHGLTDIAGQLYVDSGARDEFRRLIDRDGAVADFQVRIRRLDGQVRWISEDARAVRSPDGTLLYYEGTVQDVTERLQAEERLRHDAGHDGLTGLLNRAAFEGRVAGCLRRAADRPFTVLFLDLDRFKLINDSLGHAVGDRLLVEVAARVAACLPDTSTAVAAGATGGPPARMLGRLGGDEFAVLLEGPGATDDAVAVADRVRDALTRPFAIGGQEIVTGTSIGIAAGHAGYASPKDLLRDADAAMYRAKAEGRGRYAVFDTTMHEAAVRRLRLEADLRRAAERGELFLAYQPVVSLENRRVAGFEALLRWQHPTEGLLMPGEFIPVAEDAGLIVPIGQWVIREACRQVRRWRDARPSLPAFAVAVNLSRRQFRDPGLVALVADALAETGVEPAALKLEITESVVMADGRGTDDALRTLAAIRDLGVGLYMDDFGTGYSSLSCLHRFPIEGLKVDRAFVANMSGRRDYAAVIHAIVSLAHNLGMRVVAEGLETLDQVAMLQALDCDYGQGYHFARPLDPEAAIAVLLDGPSSQPLAA